MWQYLLLFCSGLLGATKSLTTKIIKRENDAFSTTLKRNVFAFAIGFVLIALFGIREWKYIAQAPFHLSFFYALFTFGAQISFLLALAFGPCSLSTLFYSCGFIIPTLWGSAYNHERMSVLSVCGLVLIVVSFVVSMKKEEKESKINGKWLIATAGGFVCSGLTGVVQKIVVLRGSSVQCFLMPAFAFILLLGVVVVLCFARYEKTHAPVQEGKTTKTDRRKTVFATLALGFTLGTVHTLNTYLSGVFPSYVSFPIMNGGTILLTTLFSTLIFKEKLTTKQKIGFVIGLAAIMMIALG